MALIEKKQVTPGVFWISIPDAAIHILCGCPADVVKHLIGSGLIASQEREGVVFETGPNAILLSDVSLQNGSFSNLAEFPVLQMLYRQGMILPNHPNNTGMKPLLIGREDQIKSQMSYIYRGNYGLTSKKEIVQAGIPNKLAGEMFDLKLGFAFGSIKKTEELLDSLVVGNERIEIRNGVFIRRKELNIYEITYKSTSVTVDLNLAPHDRYELPYQLEYHNIEREYFSVIHSGEGDGWNIHRPCMSSILTFQGKIYLIDAGPNMEHILNALGIGRSEIEGIFHTHAHDDHLAGLLTLVRDKRINYYATPLVRDSVFKKLSALISVDERKLMEYFVFHELEFDAWHNIDGLEVRPVYSPHPVETNIFFFRTLWEGSYRSYAHFGDIAGKKVLERMIRKDSSGPGITKEFFDKVMKDYSTPAQIKKLDCGEGMIHGQIFDFKNDKSEKILISHFSYELSNKHKQIGSDAPFGAVDVLIPSGINFLKIFAFDYLSAYFPNVPRYDIQMLLNYPIVHFNAGAILIREGAISEYVYLILTGMVEHIRPDIEMAANFSTGSIIGDLPTLLGNPASGTYRSVCPLSALRVPRASCVNFLERNNLRALWEILSKRLVCLRSAWLFGDAISYPLQNRLANSMKEKKFIKGESLPAKRDPTLVLLENGKLKVSIDDLSIVLEKPGDFCGEDMVLMESPISFHIEALMKTIAFEIPAEALSGIPVVNVKLLQTFEKRMKYFGKWNRKETFSFGV